jgi:hypothetical protein
MKRKHVLSPEEKKQRYLKRVSRTVDHLAIAQDENKRLRADRARKELIERHAEIERVGPKLWPMDPKMLERRKKRAAELREKLRASTQLKAIAAAARIQAPQQSEDEGAIVVTDQGLALKL